MPDKENFAELVEKYMQGMLSVSEKEVFFQLFKNGDLNPELEAFLWQNYQQNIATHIWPDDFRHLFSERMAKRIIADSAPVIDDGYSTIDAPAKHHQTSKPAQDEKQVFKFVNPVRRIHFHRQAFFRYAAAILLLTGAAVVTLVVSSNRKSAKPGTFKSITLTDRPPGGERAMLTLADGSRIVLDSAANGNVAKQGNAQIIKLVDGQVVYSSKGPVSKEVVWNTMSTPPGGQYQVTLSDGTKVWLNASSSIQFPTTFPENQRKVKIEGEVYFEVVNNKQKPFVVEIDENSLVEVLGTSFNINSYPDERIIKTTLLEGSVKVISNGASDRVATHSAILKPSQQALLTPAMSYNRQASGAQRNSQQKLEVINGADIEQVMAWKNGLFQFDRTQFADAMRQLARWYDVKVVYEDKIPDIKFGGRMKRDLSLSQVLEGFGEMGVKFRIDGKKLIITQ